MWSLVFLDFFCAGFFFQDNLSSLHNIGTWMKDTFVQIYYYTIIFILCYVFMSVFTYWWISEYWYMWLSCQRLCQSWRREVKETNYLKWRHAKFNKLLKKKTCDAKHSSLSNLMMELSFFSNYRIIMEKDVWTNATYFKDRFLGVIIVFNNF